MEKKKKRENEKEIVGDGHNVSSVNKLGHMLDTEMRKVLTVG